MLDWLTASCWLFGLAGQNWMLLVGGGLAIYIAALIFVQRQQARRQQTEAARYWTTARPAAKRAPTARV
jgi:hypothetical protein